MAKHLGIGRDQNFYAKTHRISNVIVGVKKYLIIVNERSRNCETKALWQCVKMSKLKQIEN